MRRVVNLTMKEAHRYKVISEVKEGYLKVREAAEILGLSQRRIYRIKGRVEKEGIEGVIHKSKGRNAPRWLTEKIRDKIDYLYKTKYLGFSLTHMTGFLNSEKGIRVSRESVRQILLEKGSYTKQRRYPRHRQCREPCSREGRMVQFDTSDHDWHEFCVLRLEGRDPKLYFQFNSLLSLIWINTRPFALGSFTLVFQPPQRTWLPSFKPLAHRFRGGIKGSNRRFNSFIPSVSDHLISEPSGIFTLSHNCVIFNRTHLPLLWDLILCRAYSDKD